jgi:hypothetical protein
MPKLKLNSILDDKPVKITVELPAAVHRDLTAYAEILGQENGQAINDPAKLIAPMLVKFMATDRAFAKARRSLRHLPGAVIAIILWLAVHGGPATATIVEGAK